MKCNGRSVKQGWGWWSVSGFAAAMLAGCGGSSPSPTPAVSASPTEAAPVVLYTDLVSGPVAGGENGKGTYLSVFGRHFGRDGMGTRIKVLIGGVEVDNYRYLGASKGLPDVDQITVQVGALGGAPVGVSQPVKVVVSGQASNTDHGFTPNPGHVYFVDNVAGDDDTAAPDDAGHPYRHVQTPDLNGGVWPVLQAGDVVVMRGRGERHPWHDVGFEQYFLRIHNRSGSAPTGLEGSGPVTVMAYPGEDVFIRGTLEDGMSGGCLSGTNGATHPGMGQWIVVTGLRADCEGYDGPLSQQIKGDHWRVINNDFSASTAPRAGDNAPRMAGITGNGEGSVWLGNHLHDIQGSSEEAHGIYIDGNGSYDIGWNYIHDIRDGNGFQVYVNGSNGSVMADNIAFHHNLVHDIEKHGINLADGSRNNIKLWNNIIYNVGLAGVRFNSLFLKSAGVWFNTFYNTHVRTGDLYGVLTNDWLLPPGAIDVRNNIFVVAPGTPYVGGSVGFAGVGGVRGNLWWGGVDESTSDADPMFDDPLFVAPASGDFRLQANSPARLAGREMTAVEDDFVSVSRDVAPSLGALE